MVLTVNGRVGGMAAARTFRVVGVDRPPGDGGNSVLDEAGLVQRVGVDGHLHVELVRDTQAAVDGRGGGAPILVQFQTAGARAHLFLQRSRQTAVALAQETEVDRERLRRLQHALQVPGTCGAGGGVGAGGRAGAAAQQGRQAARQRRFHQLRANKMDMAVDAAGGGDQVFPGDDLGSGADHQPRIDARLNQRIAGFADADDAAVAHADVAFDDAPVVENDHIGDDQIQGRLGGCTR
jgi:hypothetical protein